MKLQEWNVWQLQFKTFPIEQGEHLHHEDDQEMKLNCRMSPGLLSFFLTKLPKMRDGKISWEIVFDTGRVV